MLIMNLFLTITDSKNFSFKKNDFFHIFRMTDNQPPERYELEQLLSRDQLEIPGKFRLFKAQG